MRSLDKEDVSKGGKQTFQRRKITFPREETQISSLGNLFFQSWSVFGNLTNGRGEGRAALTFYRRNKKSPRRRRQILPNFDLLLPNFDLLLPNFYIPSPWGIFTF